MSDETTIAFENQQMLANYRQRFNACFNNSQLPQFNIKLPTFKRFNCVDLTDSDDDNIEDDAELNEKEAEAKSFLNRIKHSKIQRRRVLKLKSRLFKYTQAIIMLKHTARKITKELTELSDAEKVYNELLSTNLGCRSENSKKGNDLEASTSRASRNIDEQDDECFALSDVDMNIIAAAAANKPKPMDPIQYFAKYSFECPICFETSTGANMIFSLQCTHHVCISCTEKLENDKCPICRNIRVHLYKIIFEHNTYKMQAYTAPYETLQQSRSSTPAAIEIDDDAESNDENSSDNYDEADDSLLMPVPNINFSENRNSSDTDLELETPEDRERQLQNFARELRRRHRRIRNMMNSV